MLSKTYIIKTHKDWIDYTKDYDGYIAGVKASIAGGVKEPFVITFQDAKKYKSQQQNKAFHALLQEFVSSGFASYRLEKLKNKYKKQVGLIAGTIYLYYIDDKIKKVYRGKGDKRKVDAGYVDSITFPDSWSHATKTQAKNALDFLIKDMIEAGVNTNKFQEIMKGLSEKDFLPSKNTTMTKITTVIPEEYLKMGYKDEKYKKYVRSFKCPVCEKFGSTSITRIEAHHWQTRTNHALSCKPSDAYCTPLCCKHHRGDEGVHNLNNKEFLSRFSDIKDEVEFGKILLNNYMEWKNV